MMFTRELTLEHKALIRLMAQIAVQDYLNEQGQPDDSNRLFLCDQSKELTKRHAD